MKKSKQNKRDIEKRNDELKRLKDLQIEALKEAQNVDRSLSNVMRNLIRLHENDNNAFKLEATQRTIIENNLISALIPFMKGKTLRKWNREELNYNYFRINGKTVRRIQTEQNKKENKNLVKEKMQAIRDKFVSDFGKATGIKVDANKVDVQHTIETIKHERKFSMREVLTLLIRAQAEFKAHGNIKSTRANIEAVLVPLKAQKKSA